jgi:signal transduction histidine kinase
MRISLRTKLVALVLAVLMLAVGAISYQGLRFFQRDKTTYVFDLISQVVTVQSQELEQKIASLNTMMEIFAQVAESHLPTNEREGVLKKFNDFLFIATFNIQASTENPTATILIDDLVLANRQRLEHLGFDPTTIKNDPQLLKNLPQAQPFWLINLTHKDSTPVVALLLKSSPEKLVVGLITQEALLDIATTKKSYLVYVVNQQGDLIMHPDGMELLKRRNLAGISAIVDSWIQNPNLSQTKEYSQDDHSKILGAYAGLRKFPLGLFVEVPKDEALMAAKRLIQASSLLAAAVFIICCLFGVLFAYQITRPIKKLSQLTTKIAKGDFSAKTDIHSNDEIGELAQSFNKMSTELNERDQKLAAQNQQLVQSEKMSAFGQMSAGIAHEVKNPLAGILGYAQLAKRKLEETSPIVKYIDIIEKETKRCKEIIENLMRFARQEKSVFEPFQVNQAIRDSLALVDHQISIHGVKIQTELADDKTLPQVVGSANQLQQVLMNLMLNAQHAMEGGGNLIVRSSKNSAGKAIIQVADTGHGIAPENLKKIFEPFFTTKAAGQGTGLGLAVSYGIIKELHGEITVESTQGKGTTFSITLPAMGTAEAPAISK